jgi:tRNA/tmRNA/rRNA uracil-C5-methylase (TrmA/RlmC/RlmD family)
MTTTFSEIIHSQYSKLPSRRLSSGECQTTKNQRCSLCFSSKIDYATELKYKQTALSEFWKSLGTFIDCESLIPSPLGRNYRNVSKRKAFIVGKRFFLGLIGVNEDSSKSFPMDIEECIVEPKSHAEIYAAIQEVLQRKEESTLVKEFNYVVIKGDDKESIVIFNMNHFSSSNRREVNALSKHLTSRVKSVSGIFVFVDEERSKYYLSGTPRKGTQSNPKPLTKVFGKDKLFHKVGDVKFLYSPLSFTQTNHSIIKSFVETAGDFLSLTKDDILYDLYCGYGLFSLSFAKKVKSVTALELSRSSIHDGIDNAHRNTITNTKFVAADISADTLDRFSKFRPTKILLDPPRNGTNDDVIEFLAGQGPEKVVHIFCNTDIIEKELRRWHDCGYDPVKAQPFDMFPGTDGIEMMVLLEKINNKNTIVFEEKK